MRVAWPPRSRRAILATFGLLAAILGGSVAGASAAQAHPLGNFTVNHYNALTLSPDGIELLTIIDSAEIPTQQSRPAIDVDGDGELSQAELAEHAVDLCREVQSALRLDVDGTPTQLQPDESSLETVPGQAGLPTLRTACTFTAEADLDVASTVSFSDQYRTDRIGWHEITATGAGVRLVDSPVPAETVSDELRNYPVDLLSSPLDVRSVTLRTEPGQADDADTGAEAGVPGFTGSDPFSRLVTAGDRQLDAFIGDRELTPVIGALALLLAVLLGAGHSVLPGHGKTVMAAYLAGRRGRPMDAIIVGATVTGTHTIGVLVLGLLLTVSTAFAGEQALRYLGIISGLLIAAIGIGLLRDALRARRAQDPVKELVEAGHGHSHGHSHGGHGHSHGSSEHTSRRGLIGMGVAGGLVPSPSALVVLLGSIALGRTVFGVFLVFAYGLGMAATLTAVGLVLVRLRGRLDHLVDGQRTDTLAARTARVLPTFTAALVLVVGLALVARGLLFTV